MAILEGLQIQNYRALRDVTLGKTLYEREQDALPRLVTVIGANGSGKSSLLDALGFLGDCLAEGVEAACDKSHRLLSRQTLVYRRATQVASGGEDVFGNLATNLPRCRRHRA